MINVVVPNEIKPERIITDRVIDLRKGEEIDISELVRYSDPTGYKKVTLWPATYKVVLAMLSQTVPFMILIRNDSNNEALKDLQYIPTYILNESTKFEESILDSIIEINPTRTTCAMEFGRQLTLYNIGLNSIFHNT